jgi:hypothetical protein
MLVPALLLLTTTTPTTPTTPTATVIATAVAACTCSASMMGEPAQTRTVKADELVGWDCQDEGSDVVCSSDVLVSTRCARSCVKTSRRGPLTRAARIDAVKAGAPATLAALSTDVSDAIAARIATIHPGFVAAVVDAHPARTYFARFSPLPGAVLRGPVRIGPRTVDLVVVFFHATVDDAVDGRLLWSFWDRTTGELVHVGPSPHGAADGAYVHRFCLAAIETDDAPRRLYLGGSALGPMDAVGCCGPYDLGALAERGPVKVDRNLFAACGASEQRASPFGVPGIAIDGPANIRNAPDAKAGLVGTCADRSTAYVVEERGRWALVYCDHNLGWTNVANLRRQPAR